MIDNTDAAEAVQKKYTTGPNGEKSSGRLMKLQSFWMAVLFAAAGMILIRFSDPSTASILATITTTLVISFLTVATGSEITQKLTGK